MAAGEWRADRGAPIELDAHGALRDGLHPLSAVVESRCTVVLNVDAGSRDGVRPPPPQGDRTLMAVGRGPGPQRLQGFGRLFEVCLAWASSRSTAAGSRRSRDGSTSHSTSAGKVISIVLVTRVPPSTGSQTKLAWKSDIRLPICLRGKEASVTSIRWPAVNVTGCTSLGDGIGKPGSFGRNWNSTVSPSRRDQYFGRIFSSALRIVRYP